VPTLFSNETILIPAGTNRIKLLPQRFGIIKIIIYSTSLLPQEMKLSWVGITGHPLAIASKNRNPNPS